MARRRIKNSIRNKLMFSIMGTITVLVISITIILFIILQNYYYGNMERFLTYRMETSLDIYKKYYSNMTIDELLREDIDSLWGYTRAEIQVLDINGNLKYDSIGANVLEPIETTDVKEASKGNIHTWIGNASFTPNRIMVVTGPLEGQDSNIIGYLRFVSSLSVVNRDLRDAGIYIGLIGLLVILLTFFASILISNSIVRPLQELTKNAEKMADGQLKVRNNMDREDEIGKLANTMDLMAKEIIEKEQIKNDFISSISHELRTPLTSIKGWAVVLKSLKPEEKDLMLEGIDIIENETDRLTKMVEDLLDFSRFISGRIVLDKESFNISVTCLNVAKQLRPRFELNKIEFIVDVKEERAVVLGDENRIKQLLINLIDNALKFTSEEGWVKFSAYLEENRYIILISDGGQGISRDELQFVKEKFYKGKHSKSHSGIGLSISDEITKLHNGSLDIFSEEGIGTTVRAIIPIKEEE